ncbi:vitamin K epoxide reductase family protein [Rubrivirga sp.]|uniref:vitamin K epoxide reductase family protein n=1 Tax=Rubrivirga sp. TaxID=1885344 RepID=UPI003C730D46
MALPAQTSTLRRVIVGVALLGVVVVTHLALQKANGFANGCTGLGSEVAFDATAATTGTTAGCAAVTESEYADFLGIPNIALGLIFYVVLALLRLGYVMIRDNRLRLASGAMTSVGFAYTGYLVYLQAAVIGAFCPLCMASAAIVTLLFVLHVVEHRRLGTAVAPDKRRRVTPEPQGVGALRPYSPVLGGFAVLLLLTFGLGSRTEAAQASPGGQANVQGVNTPTPRIQDVTGSCDYDPDFELITDLSAFTDGPVLGNADSDVSVVKVFDPNCPHCKDLSETMDGFIAENGESAAYYYVPYPLRQQSLGQVIALKLAEEEGKFFDLMKEMFDRQDQSWGMTMPELVATVTAAGMNGADFEALLNDQEALQPVLDRVQADADAVNAAFATSGGGISVPKLAVNGRVVASTFAAYSGRCLGEFIAQADAAPVEVE